MSSFNQIRELNGSLLVRLIRNEASYAGNTIFPYLRIQQNVSAVMFTVFWKILLIGCFFSLTLACSSAREQSESAPNESTLVSLPIDLKRIPDTTLLQLQEWVKDAEVIGIAEGEHGMNEGMDFRNAYIKYLVETKQLQVIAIESGLLESRLVNDYINGSDMPIDSVLNVGFSYTFGNFEQNKELISWFRETNKSRSQQDRVRFYGFDMAGNAPNPFMDDGAFALKTCLNYIQRVDKTFHTQIFPRAAFYFSYLNLPALGGEKERTYNDLSSPQKIELKRLMNELMSTLEKNADAYVMQHGQDNYEWGVRSARCAQQNVEFMEGYLKMEKDQSSRERFMLENLKWIRAREGNKKVLLFAHIAHLAKDISRQDEHGKETIPNKMFGELLGLEFGDKYKLIGNFFQTLDYYDAVDSITVNSFPDKLGKKYSAANFCLKIDKSDSLFLKRQQFGIPFKGALWMTPAKGVDVVLYIREEHLYFKE